MGLFINDNYQIWLKTDPQEKKLHNLQMCVTTMYFPIFQKPKIAFFYGKSMLVFRHLEQVNYIWIVKG